MTINLNKLRCYREVLKDYFGLNKFSTQDNLSHIKAAIRWLCNAQDNTPDNGISRSYHLLSGWSPSYPETTGYIIPTMFAYFHFTQEEEYKSRALKMADWEIDVQLECGAIQAGMIDCPQKKPTVFNTGQVLFGCQYV